MPWITERILLQEDDTNSLALALQSCFDGITKTSDIDEKIYSEISAVIQRRQRDERKFAKNSDGTANITLKYVKKPPTPSSLFEDLTIASSKAQKLKRLKTIIDKKSEIIKWACNFYFNGNMQYKGLDSREAGEYRQKNDVKSINNMNKETYASHISCIH